MGKLLSLLVVGSFFVLTANIGLASEEMGFTNEENAEKISVPLPVDKDVEAKLNAPESPIVPNSLPIEEPPPPQIHKDVAQEEVTKSLPPKKAKYSVKNKKKKIVAVNKNGKKKKKSKHPAHALAEKSSKKSTKVASTKSKKAHSKYRKVASTKNRKMADATVYTSSGRQFF